MNREMIVCIPGSWEDRSDFIRQRESANLLSKFNYWRMIEPKELKPGETFRLDDSVRHYRLELRPDRMNPPGDLFHNPYGLWHLALVAVG